jgi:hypothetical protein
MTGYEIINLVILYSSTLFHEFDYRIVETIIEELREMEKLSIRPTF